MSHEARVWCFYRGWSCWNFLCQLAVFISCLDPTAELGCSDCTETLTAPSGRFTSPCFPREYVANLNCQWTLRAPPGFIVQLTFHEFEIEEAKGCPYDFVSINTGAEPITFCGVTAKGHTLNSTGSEMIVTFKTDFSIQKRGFSATYKQVAVSLRNQKVLARDSRDQAVTVAPSVTLRELRQFTVCLEVRSSSVKEKWVLFSYADSGGGPQIDFRKENGGVRLVVAGAVCDLDRLWEDHFSGHVIAGAWRRLCIAWDGSSGDVVTQTQDKYQLNPCPASRSKVVAGGGSLTLAPRNKGPSKTYTGELYNFRLWNFTMSGPTLLDLTCDEMGSVVDWETSFWDIPIALLEADDDLSCATTLLTQTTIKPTFCSSGGSGCQGTNPPLTEVTTQGTREPTETSTNPPLTEVTTQGTTEPSTNPPITEVTTQGTRESTEPSTNPPLTEVTTQGTTEPTEPNGSFNDSDLQGFQVLAPAVIRAHRGLLNASWNSQTERRTASGRNPLGIISTPLRYSPRPRPDMANASKPGILDTHSASIVFTKVVTKRPHGSADDSKALKRVTSSVGEASVAEERFTPNPFPTGAGDGSVTNRGANASRLALELVTRSKKPMNQSWDLKVAIENSTGNTTEEDKELDSSFEMLPIALEGQEELTEEAEDAGLGMLYTSQQSIPSALSPSQHVIGHRSSGLLKTVGIQPQTPPLVWYPTIRPTPPVSVHKVSVQTSAVPHGHLLYGSLWMATSSSNLMGNPLNTLHVPLRDQFNTETAAPSLHDNSISSVDPLELTFRTYHSDIKSSGTALPKDNSNILSSWPPSPGRAGSDDAKPIMSSTAIERDNRSSVTVNLPTVVTDSLYLTNHFGQESITPTHRLLISTEELENQLRQSEEFTLPPGQFSVRGQGEGAPILVHSTHTGSLAATAKSDNNLDHPGALASVSSAQSTSDAINTPSTPSNFWDNSPAPSTSKLNEGVRHLQYNTETLLLGPPELSIHPSLSGMVQSASFSAAVLHPGAQTHIEMTSASVATRVSESPPAQTSHLAPLTVSSSSTDSQRRLSAGTTSPHLFPVSKKWTDHDHSQTSLTAALQITQSQQRVTESKLRTLAPTDTGLLAKDQSVSLVPLHISPDLTSGTLRPKIDSSAVADHLKSSLETSMVNVGSTWTATLDWILAVTDMLQPAPSDIRANVRHENATSLNHDILSELEQIPTLTPNSSRGSRNGTDFPSFPLTVSEGAQNHFEIISRVNKSSAVASGSHTQEQFVAFTTQSAKELDHQLSKDSADNTNPWSSWLGFVPDRTDRPVPRTSGIPGLKWEPYSNSLLETSKDLQVVTAIPVHLGAQWTFLSTHTPPLTKSPQLVNSAGIFTETESERTPITSSAQLPKDPPTIVLNITLTSQKQARTLNAELYAEEPHTSNSVPFSVSAPVSEGLSVGFTSTTTGSQDLIQLPTVPMNPSAALSMNAPPTQSAWGIVTSTGAKTLLEQPLQPFQTSATRLSSLESFFPSAGVTPPPVPSRDVHGLNAAPSTSLASGEAAVESSQAPVSCLCEGVEGTVCLCGVLVANRGVFYRTQFTVYDLTNGNIDTLELQERVTAWLTDSFENWNYSVYVQSVRILDSNKTSTRRIVSRSVGSTKYDCLAILYYNITKNIYLEERIVQERLTIKSTGIGNRFSIDSIQVQPVVNCSLEEKPAQYVWEDTRPMTIQHLRCLSNQGQYASRKCELNMQNYTSYWRPPDLSNCLIVPTANPNGSDIENIPEVSADNAADVANQLLDFTADKNLTREEVDKLVETLKQIVIVSEINSSLASTVLTVLSNILSSSDTALVASSQLALNTVDHLAIKLIFTGPSVSITTRNLAIGISAVDSGNYTGTSFSVGSQNADSELEVNFEGDPGGEPLADIELPPDLLEQLTDDELSAVSRTQFAFFSKTGLFQDPGGFALQSFVIASSVGNISINNLSNPVKIRIKHRQPEEQFKPQCAFWDLKLNNGSGGWSIQGCRVDPVSSANETICLCDHLTHFGVLLDISGTAQQIDAVNTRILTFITHIGCGISAIFSATTLLTYVAFEKLRRDYPSKILMNLSTSLFFLNLLFLIDGWLASFNIPGLCIAVAAFLHFFLLASFTWMGLEAVHMYIALVKVFNTYIRKYMLKFFIIGWGLPALVVIIVLAIDKNFYGVDLYGKDDTDNGASEFCWINHRIVFYVTCVCYFVILFLMNVAMFIVVLIQICGRNGKKSNRNLREEILRNLRSVVSLTFLLGMTWGFAFFAWGPVNLAFMYLFAIFNSLQGFFIFVFHCALKENVQKQWRRYLCCGRFRLPENSDWSRTITNNTKKVSSENLGKSLSSSSIGSNSTSWTTKFKPGSTFFKSNSKGGLFGAVAPSQFDHLDAHHQEPVVPVHNVLDKVTSYYPTHSDNFYKNIMMSENFSHSTKF